MVDLYLVNLVVIVGVAFLSLLSSIATLALIKLLKKWNGYLELVTSLTVCQGVYDMAFLLILAYNSPGGKGSYLFFHMLGGLSSTLWSNVIMFVTCRIVTTIRSVDIHKNYWIYFLCVMFPSFVLAVLNCSLQDTTYVQSIYLILKSLSLITNVFTFAIIMCKIQRMNVEANGKVLQGNENPVFVLAMRLQYYCIVQTVTRIGASWYQIHYGFNEYDSHDASTIESIAFLCESALTPLAGVGYLLVFLCIQPEAWEKVKLMCCGCCCSNNNSTGDEYHEYSTTSELLRSSGVVSFGPNSTITTISNFRESEFPLLDMDEDGLANEIDNLTLSSK